MLKLTLQENYRQEFIDYTKNRMQKSSNIKLYSYLTNSILNNTFTFFLEHRLTVEANAKSYWYQSGKKQIESYGYSGHSVNDRDDVEGIKDNLFNEVFCKAEWVARSLTEGYSETCRATIGNENFNNIITC